MWRKLLGYLLLLGAAGTAAIGIARYREPNADLLSLLGPLFLSLLLIIQARIYLRGRAHHTVMRAVETSEDAAQSAFDSTKRMRLIEKLEQMSGPRVVPAREFFDGNYSDQGAIGPNLWPEHPGIPAFAASFESLLRRSDVEAIYVEVAEVEPDHDSWPYSDRVYIFGDVSDEILAEETKILRPTEIRDRTDIFSPISESVRLLSRKPLHVLWWD